MDYKNWYALSINMNKERSAKAELLARKAVFQDTYLEDVEYLQRKEIVIDKGCLLYTSPSPRDKRQSRMPSSA